jgi:serine/threonine protein kinase
MIFKLAVAKHLKDWNTILEQCCIKNDFTSKYNCVEELGSGGQAVVYRTERVKDQRVHAVKVVKKKNIICNHGASEAIIRELRALRKLHLSNNITHLYRLYEDKESIYMVTELCKGGSLNLNIFDRFTEYQAKQICIQLLLTIDLMSLH